MILIYILNKLSCYPRYVSIYLNHLGMSLLRNYVRLASSAAFRNSSSSTKHGGVYPTSAGYKRFQDRQVNIS